MRINTTQGNYGVNSAGKQQVGFGIKLADPKLWETTVEKNEKDPYGKAIIRFAKKWAEGMEEHIEKGVPLSNIASSEKTKADTEWITGFMYGCAVDLLSKAWKHGEELAKWHNSKFGKAGEEATKKGGVINPALLIVKDKI